LCHYWQRLFGGPGRRTFHNREWPPKMKRVGLDPSEIKTGTGEPTGRMTGQTVTHRIRDGGPFDLARREITPRACSSPRTCRTW
jgi:hypothetical protein